MRVANLILAHKNPKQLLELIDLYPSDLFQNWLHLDSRCDQKEFDKIIRHPNVKLVKSRKILWAGYSMVDATISGLIDIIKEKEDFCYINLMSGLDLPIKQTSTFHKFLNNSYQESKAEYFQITDLSSWNARHRFEDYHLSDVTIKGRYFLERIINYVNGKREFYYGKITPYGHSQWFTATSDFIEFALLFFRENPDYLKFLKTMWGPDEFVFNSLIMASPMKNNLSDRNNLRYIDWSEKNASPKTLRVDDFSKIANSNNFIARKFDSQIDRQIIDMIKDNLL